MNLRSLYARLAAALLGLLLVAGLLGVALSLFTARRYVDEANQRLHASLATNLVAERILMRDGELDRAALEHVFHVLMVINPQIECYLLDPGGRVLAFSAPPGHVRRHRVSTGPIEAFLDGPGELPITGDDPRNPGRRKVFSAARIPGPDGGVEGYLYVVLGGEQYESIAALLRGSYALRLGAGLAGGALLVVLGAGLVLFRLLTRRLRLLASALDRFRARGFAEALPPGVRSGGGDEIDRLADSYVQMADRIGEQIHQLERTDHLRRELVANVSHDLRTPLAALQGYLETLLIKNGTLKPEEQRRFLDVAARHSARLGRLVGQLFDLARLDAGALQLRPEPFSLAELAQDVVGELQLEAEDRGVRLEADLGRELPFVVGDIGLIERVFANLVENALRHTPLGGTVRVAVAREETLVRAVVSDTGCGIPGEDLRHVFERYYRSARGPDRGGAGLGLAIAKKIVELHRGTIEAWSALGAGTKFTVRLPQAPPGGS